MTADGFRLESYISTLAASTILDVGCGQVALMDAVKDQAPRKRAIGLDQSFSQLKASQGVADRLIGDGCRLPFASESIDAVVMQAFLRAVEPIERPLEEAYRVLKKNGHLIVVEGEKLNVREFYDMKSELIHRGILARRNPGFDPDELATSLSGQGFIIDDIVFRGKSVFASPPFADKIYSTKAFTILARKSVPGQMQHSNPL